MALKTHAVANAGIALGGTTIVAALIALFTYLSSSDNLYALVLALGKLHRNVELTDADVHALISLAAVLIALFGAITVALVSTYLGKSPLTEPPTTPPVPPAQGDDHV